MRKRKRKGQLSVIEYNIKDGRLETTEEQVAALEGYVVVGADQVAGDHINDSDKIKAVLRAGGLLAEIKSRVSVERG